MKLAVIYHSETENTKQAAEWIADGMNEVSGVGKRYRRQDEIGTPPEHFLLKKWMKIL